MKFSNEKRYYKEIVANNWKEGGEILRVHNEDGRHWKESETHKTYWRQRNKARKLIDNIKKMDARKNTSKIKWRSYKTK